MILTNELKVVQEWEPDAEALAFGRWLVASIKDGGSWVSSNGVCVVDHKAKTFTAVVKAGDFDALVHEKTRKTLAKLGYTLVDIPMVKVSLEGK